MRNIESVLGDDSSALTLGGNRPQSLDVGDGVWLVTAGYVDVFTVPVVGGQPAGERVHLYRAGPGTLVFAARRAVDGGAVGLLAVGGPETQVRPFTAEQLSALAGDPEWTETVTALWDRWALGLTEGLGSGPAPKPVRPLAPGTDGAADGAANAVAAQGTVWVSQAEGTSRFLGRDDLPLGPADGPVPLAGHGWLAVPPGARLTVRPGSAIVASPQAWPALRHFHQLVAHCAEEDRRRSLSAHEARLHTQAEAQSRLLRSTLARLAAVAAPDGEVTAPVAGGDPPLVAACRLVGDRLGVAVRAPARWAVSGHGADPVAAIARASRVRVRKVLLSGDWWRRDNGPLLAFHGEDERPVALLPVSPSCYERVDPVTEARDPVTAALAAEVRPFGYMFYEPFPARVLSLRDVMRLGLRAGTRDVATVVLVGVVGGLLGMLPPIVMGWVFDSIAPGLSRWELLPILAALAFGATSAALLHVVQGVATLRVQTRAEGAVEAGLWDRLLNLPASFFRDYSAGDLAARAMGISSIRQVLTEVAWTTLVGVLFSLVSFALLFAYDARLALLTAALVTGLAAITILTSLRQLHYERKLHDQRGRVSGLVLQLISGLSRLRVAGAESRALALWVDAFSKQRRLALGSRALFDTVSAFDAAASGLATLVLYGAIAATAGEGLTIGKFLAFNAAFAQILAGVGLISANAGLLLQVVPLYERAGPILRGAPEVDETRAEPGELSGEIEVNHVSFRYQADGPLVLDDVSLHIRPGQFVALVGPSGAGKSTLFRLLLGFEAPTAGSIYFDHQDLSVIDPQAVRRQIGVVLQNGKLSPGDIRSNIIGTSSLTLDDAWEAARLSGLDEDISRMPMGMFTVVSEGESTFSGGQRQRLMIARAIVHRPRILFFDEATSALDNATQARVRRSLAEIKATRIVVAHRLSTIEHADTICVLDAGRIVQQGTYDDLIAQPGLFAELVKRQIA